MADFGHLPLGFLVDSKYKLVQQIQKGTGGEVYLVESELTNSVDNTVSSETGVLKLFKGEAEMKLFYKEYQVCEHLNKGSLHQNICKAKSAKLLTVPVNG